MSFVELSAGSSAEVSYRENNTVVVTSSEAAFGGGFGSIGSALGTAIGNVGIGHTGSVAGNIAGQVATQAADRVRRLPVMRSESL